MSISIACGLALGHVADRLFADPSRGHPVAAFGQVASLLERGMWADSRARGTAFAGALVGGTAVLGWAAQTAARRPWQRTALTAVVTWAVLGGRSLEREGETMAHLLGEPSGAPAPDLPAARERLGHLCSRDSTGLDSGELARATVESLAENTSDAVTGALFWGAVAGVPGLVAYRAANTLDAMVGYRNARYRRFGWAAARLDDVANLVPARLTAAVTVAIAPVVTGDGAAAGRAWRAWGEDAAQHPSPNAGPVEATAAGALGVQLGGANTYGNHVEDRGTLGTGPRPVAGDVPRAVRLTRAVGTGVLAVCAALAALNPLSGPGARRGGGR